MKRAKRKNGRHEVVRVLTPAFLVSSSQQACSYETAAGRSLQPGYYLALWPVGARHSTYGCEVRYFGPFATPAEARLLQTSAVALDIVEAAAAVSVPATQSGGIGEPLPVPIDSPTPQYEWCNPIWIGQRWIDTNFAAPEIRQAQASA